MNRPTRIALWLVASLASLLVIVAIAGVMIARTAWFRDMVRRRIVQEVERSTGGDVTIAAFAFDWKNLRAQVRDFIIHGTEPPTGPPLFRARVITVDLKIVSVFKRQVDIDALIVEEPQVYLLVRPGGETNIPEPKIKRQSDKSAMETLIDLAIGRFSLQNGTFEYDDKKMPLNARGEQLRAQLSYELVRRRYTGDISIRPLQLDWGKQPRVPVNVNTRLAFETDRIEVSSAQLETPQSRVQLSGTIENLQAPTGSLSIDGELALQELARYTGGAPPRNPSTAHAKMSVALSPNRLEIASAQIELGASRFDASGTIRDLKNLEGSVLFDARLGLGDLGRRLDLATVPQGNVRVSGQGSLKGAENYRIEAKVQASDVAVRQGRTNLTGIRGNGAVVAVPNRIDLSDLRLSALGGDFTGRATVERLALLRLDGRLSDFGIQELSKALGSQDVAWSGRISGPVHARGNLKGSGAAAWNASTQLTITPTDRGIPLAGRIDANYDGRRDLLDLGRSYIATASTRLDFSGAVGTRLDVRLASQNLRDFLPAIALASPEAPKQMPVALRNGSANFDGTVLGKMSDPQVSGRVSLTNFVYQEQKFDRFTAGIDLQKSRAVVRNAVLTQGKLQATAEGSVGLQEWKTRPTSPVSASARMRGAQLATLAALAGRKDVPVTGALDLNAQVSGTIRQPQAVADVAVQKGSAYGEPFGRLQAAVGYSNDTLQLKSAVLQSPAGRVELTGSYEPSGRVQFRLVSSQIALERVQTVQKKRPGITGTLVLAADGAGALRPAPATPRFLLSALSADVSARALEVNDKHVGNLRATANTKGSDLVFRLDSDFAGSAIRGSGTWRLSGNYPLEAQVTFSPVRLSTVQELLSPSAARRSDFDGVVEGEFSISGPAVRPQEMKAALRLSKLELGTSKVVLLRNPEPVVVTLERSVARVQSARLEGKGTRLAVTGSVLVNKDNALDLRVNGAAGLDIVEAFNKDVYASGAVALNAAVRGTPEQPVVDGRLELKNAGVNMADFPSGISNANGAVAFTGKRAVIQNLTAETGGGKLVVTGQVDYGGGQPDFRLQAKVSEVRVRRPEGASTVADASLTLNGTTERSLLSGTVTIVQASFNPQRDIGASLAQTAEPPPAEKARTGFLGGLQFDIRIQSSPDIRFQTALAQGIQLDADLRLQGSVSRPSVLGRVTIAEGDVVFFGTNYTINRGTISFYNPQRIEPVVDIELETRARGIDVVLNVSGEMGKLKLTHHSDPPLQFSEVVSLLATGRAPASDPTLAARQPAAPQQSWQQMGASALLGQAVANPVSGRLQRLFGVSKLKIDPQITGVENNPQARLTLEQQVTKELTFTYITDVTQSNPQIVRIEWALSHEWAVTAVREQNGLLGLDFYYRRRFR